MSVEAYHTKHGTRCRVRYQIAGKSTDKRGFALKRDAEAWEAQQLLHLQTTSLYHGPHRTVDQLFEEAVKRNSRALKPSWLQTYAFHATASQLTGSYSSQTNSNIA